MMSYTSNPLTIMPRLHPLTDASSAPRNTRTTHVPPDILTYSFDSRMVYVTPGEAYDRAIEIAIECFPELRDVERDRIRLEVRVAHGQQRTVEIGRTAWPSIVATLARFEIVEVCVTPPPRPPPWSVRATSTSVVGSTPYGSETGLPEYSENENAQADFVAYEAHMPSLLLQPHSHTTRVAVDVAPSWSPEGRHSPQLR